MISLSNVWISSQLGYIRSRCERHNYNTMAHQRFSMVFFPNPLITIHITTIITPGLKTAPEGKLTRLAPPCSFSACLGWTLYFATHYSVKPSVRYWLLPALNAHWHGLERRDLGPSHCGVAGGGAWELAVCGNTPLYCLTTCYAVPPPLEGPSHPT